MAIYEYKTVTRRSEITSLGKEGWRLVSVVFTGYSYDYYMEKTIQDKESLSAVIAQTLDNTERNQQFQDDHPQDTRRNAIANGDSPATD
jgi:hypothetical protein